MKRSVSLAARGLRLVWPVMRICLLALVFQAGICQAGQIKPDPAKPDQIQPDQTGPKAEKTVEQAIRVSRKAQEGLDRWEKEKARLIIEYETLARQKEALEKEQEELAGRLDALENENRELALRKRESVRIRTEMIPFLEKVYGRLSALVALDSPFLKEERKARLDRLDKVLKDPGIPFSEKYRKVMEALFIEAEYGSTIEVYQDKIVLKGGPEEGALGNIFRLGRVSLFFLSLDNSLCGVFSPGSNQWESLPAEMLPAVRSAVEIGSRRRTVELLPLPLGRLVRKGGAQ